LIDALAKRLTSAALPALALPSTDGRHIDLYDLPATTVT
jgi:hypothetical protein